jgi:hypothetical protein
LDPIGVTVSKALITLNFQQISLLLSVFLGACTRGRPVETSSPELDYLVLFSVPPLPVGLQDLDQWVHYMFQKELHQPLRTEFDVVLPIDG